ncbi:MAG: thioredoxin family protein [Bacteroidales bacterium]|nr:thioredoxin family protein [Bacteroidales bacterium]
MNKITEKYLQNWIDGHELAIIFFKTIDCGVCQSQLSKIESIANEQEVAYKVVDLSENPHLTASQMVLQVPITKIFYQGKEVYKEGAFLDFSGLRELIINLQSVSNA